MISVSAYSAEDFARLAPEFQPDFRPGTSETEGGLWHVFDEAEEMVKHSPNIISDYELNAYIKNVVCKLSGDYCENIRPYIVRRPYFNASMAPNGMLQIWSGLLLRMRNEAQLATVLGHEIGHYLRKHSLKFFDNIKLKSTLFTFFTLGIAGTVATGNLDPGIGRSVLDISQLGVMGSIFAYSRDAEREADQYGIQLLYDSGLDINEAAQIWQNLLDEEAAGDDPKHRSIFFSTHPDPGERTENLHSYALALSKDSGVIPEKNSDHYWNNIGPYMEMFLDDEIKLNKFSESEYLLKSLIKDGIMPATVYYYLGELHRLRNNEGDLLQAQEYYTESLHRDNYPPQVHRSLGLIHYKNRKMDLAQEHFEKYLALVPDANDREMIEFYINFGR